MNNENYRVKWNETPGERERLNIGVRTEELWGRSQVELESEGTTPFFTTKGTDASELGGFYENFTNL